jgi:protein-S-isoprenylcysteine O-methyltransferase
MSESDSDSLAAADSSWPLERPENEQNGGPHPAPQTSPAFDPVFATGGSKALSGISRRAFGLGVTFGVTSMTTLQLAYLDISLWRATCFIATLCIFHYLEFDATARYNPSDAKISSFLLSSNGSAYNIAHTSALAEFFIWKLLHYMIVPASPGSSSHMWNLLQLFSQSVPLMIGFALVAVGQGVRTAAMAEAGRSFNHIVQSRKRHDHVLVQTGIYRFLRHPSYFGFFWWGLGTQLILGNPTCFIAYSLILWKFFATRIVKEEQFLVEFFDQDYIRYRQRTPVLIPLIQ